MRVWQNKNWLWIWERRKKLTMTRREHIHKNIYKIFMAIWHTNILRSHLLQSVDVKCYISTLTNAWRTELGTLPQSYMNRTIQKWIKNRVLKICRFKDSTRLDQPEKQSLLNSRPNEVNQSKQKWRNTAERHLEQYDNNNHITKTQTQTGALSHTRYYDTDTTESHRAERTAKTWLTKWQCICRHCMTGDVLTDMRFSLHC